MDPRSVGRFLFPPYAFCAYIIVPVAGRRKKFRTLPSEVPHFPLQSAALCRRKCRTFRVRFPHSLIAVTAFPQRMPFRWCGRGRWWGDRRAAIENGKIGNRRCETMGKAFASPAVSFKKIPVFSWKFLILHRQRHAMPCPFSVFLWDMSK